MCSIKEENLQKRKTLNILGEIQHMDTNKKSDLVRLSASGLIITAILVSFSIPLGSLPTLGNLINPNGGVWGLKHTTSSEKEFRIEGIQGNVEVIKDKYGIPHIYADNESDAFRTLGYLHAKERLIQLELTKRQASGTLSEFVGESALETDKFFRNIQLRKSAVELTEYIKKETPEAYQILMDYIGGVNYYIKNAKQFPFEFILLGAQPSLWEPVDVVLIQKYMSYMLTYSEQDLVNTYINDSLAEDYPGIMNEIFPVRTPFQIPIVPEYGSYPDEPNVQDECENEGDNGYTDFKKNKLDTVGKILQSYDNVKDPYAQKMKNSWVGSNNWVVNSSKSETGKPILCNDMHLAWSLPNIWYEAHIVAKDSGLNIQGFTIPGEPFVIVGHNEYVSWGMTNANFDHIDWYFYEGNETHYWYEPEGKYLPYNTYKETITIKDKEATEFEIKETIHGPIMNVVQNDQSSPNLTVGFQWVPLKINSTTFKGVYEMGKAKNITQFNQALSQFQMPSQNIVYADRYGNISMRCSGAVPIRNNVPKDSTDPLYLLNGSADQYSWTGDYIPFEELPYSENPDQGYLASANQLSTGPDYPYYLQYNFLSNHRARRINQLLASDDSVSVEDMKTYQLDTHSVIAEWFVPVVLDKYQHQFPTSQKTPLIEQAMEILKNWNNSAKAYKMNKDLAGPTIFNELLIQFANLTLCDELGKVLPKKWEKEAPRFFAPILENFTKNDPQNKWFDDITTDSIEENLTTILIQTISQAISVLNNMEELYGKEPEEWCWGEIHKVVFPHLTGIEAFGWDPIEFSGSTITLNPSSYWDRDNPSQFGASERMIIDFGGADNYFDTSQMVIPGGSSADPTTSHFDDQLELFVKGEYHDLWYYPTPELFGNDEIEATWTFGGL